MLIDDKSKQISYTIPLTTPSGKIRVKRRSSLYEYGIPIATKTTKFTQMDYIEWQIGYDVPSSKLKELKDLKLTSLENIQFRGANKQIKSFYELSELAYYFVKWEVIHKKEIKDIYNFLKNTEITQLIDVHPELRITRTDFIKKEILGIDFLKSEVSYPLLIHKFGNFELIAEIIIKEKQRAIGVQPMLYLCFPITELQSKTPLLNRCADTKESANFIFNNKNYSLILEMIKIFGILSQSHKHDILEILNVLTRIKKNKNNIQGYLKKWLPTI